MTLRNAMAILFMTFVSIVLVNVISFQYQIAKVNDYHYATVHEIENSDFSPSIINEKKNNGVYNVKISNKTIKEDLRIYEVTTSKTVYMPLFGVSKEYVKESVAR